MSNKRIIQLTLVLLVFGIGISFALKYKKASNEPLDPEGEVTIKENPRPMASAMAEVFPTAAQNKANHTPTQQTTPVDTKAISKDLELSQEYKQCISKAGNHSDARCDCKHTELERFRHSLEKEAEQLMESGNEAALQTFFEVQGKKFEHIQMACLPFLGYKTSEEVLQADPEEVEKRSRKNEKFLDCFLNAVTGKKIS